MTIVLFDTPASRENLYPLSLTRSLADLQFGCFSIRERWAMQTGLAVFALSKPHLTDEMPEAESYLCIDATVLPDSYCLQTILQLKPNEQVEDESGMIAYCISGKPAYGQLPLWPGNSIPRNAQRRLSHPVDIIQSNAAWIKHDAGLLSRQRAGQSTLSQTNTLIGNDIHIAEGVQMEVCIINSTEGPVVIGKNALVMEGTMIRGPVSIGEGAVVKMGTKIYPGTTIGRYCTAGGEIKNSVMMNFSNKAHDGYLGDSLLGEWCNLGAGTSNSNVKNSAGDVAVWHQGIRRPMNAGIKCGIIMGDYSRAAVNTRFNTGTMIGVSCSIHDEGIPAKHIPSFSWGTSELYEIDKAISHIANWKQLKGKTLSPDEEIILRQIWQEHAPSFKA